MSASTSIRVTSWLIIFAVLGSVCGVLGVGPTMRGHVISVLALWAFAMAGIIRAARAESDREQTQKEAEIVAEMARERVLAANEALHTMAKYTGELLAAAGYDQNPDPQITQMVHKLRTSGDGQVFHG